MAGPLSPWKLRGPLQAALRRPDQLMLLAGAAYTGITPVFTASVTTGVAPLSVCFDSSGTTAANTSHAWRDCLFGHDSGDATAGNFTHGERPGWSKRKHIGGPTWGYVYETPGTYPSTHAIWDGTGWVSRTIEILVLDPDVVFAGTNTICCSLTGDFTGAKAGADLQTVASLAAAFGFLASGKRVLLNGSDAWTTSASYYLTGTKDNMVFGSFNGTATITMTNVNIVCVLNSAGISRIKFQDLNFNGSSVAGIFAMGSTGLDITGVDFHNVHAYDCGGLWVNSGSNLIRNWSMSKCLIERVKGGGGYCGIFCSATNVVMVDSAVLDATAAEHNIRFQYIGKGYIGGVTATDCAANKHVLTVRNPAWAGGSNVNVPAGTYTEYVTISDCYFAGNTSYITSIQSASASLDARTRRTIWERNRTRSLGSGAGTGLAISGFENISRNNVYDMTLGPSYVNAVSLISNSTYTSDGNQSWNDTMYTNGAHAQEASLFTSSASAGTNSAVINGLQYSPSTNRAPVIGANAVATTTVTTTTSDAQAKALNPLFVGPLTGIAGFALDTGSPYATGKTQGRNYSDALDKIRVSNGGAHMLASNATSAWTLFGV